MDTLFTVFTALIVFALGASIGSFLNVVVYRLPAGLSVLWPPSRCPQCSHRLGTQDNVLALGCLWVRGRCRYCKSPISVRYPLVEAATGSVFVFCLLLFGFSVQ